jgi:hypothetical protein
LGKNAITVTNSYNMERLGSPSPTVKIRRTVKDQAPEIIRGESLPPSVCS